ncbi:MAG: hypothetical protein NZ750_06920 [Anaerolineae bacterium]|nr:hypothetical protein [Anaerolineae bacterium]MDW8172033.1 hypothetical protein [Anaerolineae bacterium]
MRRVFAFVTLCWLVWTALSACSPDQQTQATAAPEALASEATPEPADPSVGDTQHPAAQAVIRYLEARVRADADTMRELTCAAEESRVVTLALSFQGRDAKLLETKCGYADEERVVCQGGISASYQGEVRTFDLPNYRVVLEDGTWRVCGEAQ